MPEPCGQYRGGTPEAGAQFAAHVAGSGRLAVEDKHGDPRDAHEAFLLIVDVDFPDVAASTDVYRSCGADHIALGRSANMVRIDLLPDTALLGAIDDERRADAAERFGERHRRTAVQDAERLPRPGVDGHFRLQKIRPDLRELDAEMIRQAFAFERDFGERVGFEPDAHDGAMRE